MTEAPDYKVGESDPKDFNADVVVAALKGLEGDALAVEKARVHELESAEGAKRRSSVLAASEATEPKPDPSSEDPAKKDTSTAGKSFAEAAKDAKEPEGEHYAKGYIGVPPSVAKGEDLTLAAAVKRLEK